MYIDRGVIGLRDRQIQGVELRDKALSVEDGIRPQTRGVNGIRIRTIGMLP